MQDYLDHVRTSGRYSSNTLHRSEIEYADDVHWKKGEVKLTQSHQSTSKPQRLIFLRLNPNTIFFLNTIIFIV